MLKLNTTPKFSGSTIDGKSVRVSVKVREETEEALIIDGKRKKIRYKNLSSSSLGPIRS